MKLNRLAIQLPAALILVAAAAVMLLAQRVEATSPGVIAAESLGFSLPTSDGKSVSLSQDVDVHLNVICFLGTECPLARIYGPRLQRMSDDYRSRGVRFLGINSNVQDSLDDLRSYVTQHGISFPVAKDFDQNVAMIFAATRTPEVIVLDRGGTVRYQGRIDDQYEPGIARGEATRHDLREAIDRCLAGQAVARPWPDAVGCLISLPRKKTISDAADVTFCNQVIRVLQNHCIECHRDGEIAPFALDQYDEVVGWADMSLEVIDQGRMPPWHADPAHGSFSNARHMPEADKKILRKWVDAGMPYGSASDLPAKKQYLQGWRLPKAPDLVLAMNGQPFSVPAEGTVEYQYFVVDPGFKEDKWIRAAEVVPGNRAVVHHCIAFARPPDGSDIRDIGMLSGYVPGQRSVQLPDGYARRVPAGSKIVFQMHYTPTGKPETDLTRIGLLFADPNEVTHEIFALGGIQQEFEIPPDTADYRVEGDLGWFPRDGLLLSIAPHMHLRGKSFQMTAETDTGSTKLLVVDQYDFNWQHSYELAEPLPLESVKSLKFTATFDNSAENPTNPDPSEYVTWGDQTWQEMAVAFLAVAQPRTKTIESTSSRPEVKDAEADEKIRQRYAEIRRKAEAFADDYIKKLDKNGDGSLAVHELPRSVQRYGYMDHNDDARISRDEIISEAIWRFESSQ